MRGPLVCCNNIYLSSKETDKHFGLHLYKGNDRRRKFKLAGIMKSNEVDPPLIFCQTPALPIAVAQKQGLLHEKKVVWIRREL